MQGPLQELLRFAAAPDVAVAARYYADKVVAATRAAVAKARTEGSKNKTRHSLRLIYPGTADDKAEQRALQQRHDGNDGNPFHDFPPSRYG